MNNFLYDFLLTTRAGLLRSACARQTEMESVDEFITSGEVKTSLKFKTVLIVL